MPCLHMGCTDITPCTTNIPKFISMIASVEKIHETNQRITRRIYDEQREKHFIKKVSDQT